MTIAVYVRSCVDQDDPAAAISAAKAAAGEYASYPAYARQFELMGLGARAEAAAAAHRAERPQDVPDDLVHAVCLVGGASDVRGRLDAYRDAGAHLPVVYPMLVPGEDAAASISATIRGLAPAAG